MHIIYIDKKIYSSQNKHMLHAINIKYNLKAVSSHHRKLQRNILKHMTASSVFFFYFV